MPSQLKIIQDYLQAENIIFFSPEDEYIFFLNCLELLKNFVLFLKKLF